MYVLTGEDDGAFAVLVKLHHALADGMRAVAIGAGILDQLAAAAAPGAAAPCRPLLAAGPRARSPASPATGSASSPGPWASAPP